MKRINLCFLFLLLSIQARAELSHRAGIELGGIHLIMGYGLSLGALYQMAFHKNFALELNGNYNFGIMALGQGPTYSGGLDISLQAMLYNFGDKIFSKGFGFRLGLGMHYLVNFNENRFRAKKEALWLFPVNVGIFYQHLFDNSWFIKTGIKGYVANFSYRPKSSEVVPNTKINILPSVYFDFGYCF